MNSKLNDDFYAQKLEILLAAAVTEILEHETPDRFLGWCREHLHKYYPSASPDHFATPQDHAAAVISLGRGIWNATPLPGNNFRPMPLPEPGRNNLCFCDSTKKYKHCCARQPSMPAFDSHLLWFQLVEQLPQASLQDAIDQGRVPIETLVNMSNQYLGQGQEESAISLLEPLFTGNIHKTNEAADYALNLLCNCYDETGQIKTKNTLLKQIVETIRRSPLRSGAWQRLAAVRMDRGEIKDAWEAFRQALQDDPGSLSLGVLEVQLLMAEDRLSDAKTRANFWVKQLHRSGLSGDEGPLGFLSAAAQDPATAMEDLGLMMAGDAVQHLDEWLQAAVERAVPKYGVATEPPVIGDDLAETVGLSLQRMGVGQEEFGRATAMLGQQLELNIPDQQADEEEEADDSLDSLFLVPPTVILEIERQWREVFPLDKPFSVHDEPMGEEDAWEEGNESAWMVFLDDYPEAFDSLEIIDDLVTALMQNHQYETASMDNTLFLPLLLRAADIIDQALSNTTAPRLIWVYTENRSALRSLARLILLYLRSGDETAMIDRAQHLLALNPHDNHGFRGIVVNQWLFDGDDESVLEIAKNYPQDAQPEIPYGQVLALYRLQHLEKAQTALGVAMEDLPKVVHYLTAKRVRKPKLDPMGVIFGGDDQAWLYRDEMRDLWLETPGAIDWLTQTAKQINE